MKTNAYQNFIKLVFSLIWNFTDIKCHWYQKSLVTDISLYLHCKLWVTSDVSIYLTSLNVSHFRNSNTYYSVIYERKHKVCVFIFLRNNVVPKLFVFSKYLIFAFSPPALRIGNVRVLYKIKRKFAFFRWIPNIFHLVSWKHKYFHSCCALVKIRIFSTHSMKYIWYSPQKS